MPNENKNDGGNAAAGRPSPLDQYSVQPKQEDDKSPYFKSAAPSISLPKGGGAIKGIDEKFTVNAVNGTAGLEISLPLTPGRGGFTPSLSLSYNSGSGNSEFGLGWGLSLPAIQRKGDRKLPRYDDTGESDVFLLAGAEDLVPEVDDNGNRPVIPNNDFVITRYRPRIEGLFARIEYIKENSGDASWWRVTTKDNITTYYGLGAGSRITDPEHAYRIYKWLPDMTVDHKGNVQVFEYVAENILGVADTVFEQNRKNGIAKFANTYLKRVKYGNRIPYFINSNVFSPTAPVTDWLFESVFDYGDHTPENLTPVPDNSTGWPGRSDAFSDFHAGFEIRTYRRCKRVMMFHRFTELNGGDATLVRALELVYKNDDDLSTTTETDFITAARQHGYKSLAGGGYVSRALPAMVMEYTPFSWNTEIERVGKEDFTGAPQGLTGPYQWTDFEGEGISGILTEQGGGWYYKNNLGDGHFETPKMIAPKPSFTGLGNNLQWQDLDADGRRQVVAEAPIKGYWELDDDQQWQPFRTFAKNLNVDLNSPFVKMLDLDGDGRPDILMTEDRAWTWYENKGKKGFDMGGNAPVFSDEERGPMLLLRDTVQSIFLADMNGDGMTDLVRIRNGEVCYWPNMGYGRFGAKVTMASAPVFHYPEQYNPLYLSLADISGTGAADLIYTGKNKCTAWINLSGNGWSESYDINPLPGTDAYNKITVLDFLGNGTGCIVWSSPLPQHAGAPLQYIDLMGGNKPYLMEKYHNGTGKEVSVAYKSSTKFYLDDKLAGTPWATRLPFPVQCIDNITTKDIVSGASFTQYYTYRHGYYDHEEREFRGFGYVGTYDIDKAAISDNEELDQPRVFTKSWYHTGAWIRERTLLDAFQEEYFQFEGWDDMQQIASFPMGLNAVEEREAYRALKGSPLRQEVYTLDGTAEETIPFTVTATAYKVQTIQRKYSNRHASFLNLQEQSVVFNCERDVDDTRILHSLTLKTDEYGNVLESAQVAYRRKNIPGSLPQQVRDEQEKMHITCSVTELTEDAIDDNNYAYYRLRLPCAAESYELVPQDPGIIGNGLWTIAQLRDELADAAAVDFTITPSNGQKRLIARKRTLFMDNAATTALAFQQLESLALPYESYQLAFTAAVLENCYQGRVTESMLEVAPPNGEGGGYRELDGDGRFWLPSGRAVYTAPQTKFYTPELFIDPWGNETVINFWGSYWLLPKSVTDARGNTSTVKAYDWRILQPRVMQDANDNISEILYDALGMPVAMAVKGKDDDTEGDELNTDDPLDPAYIDPDSEADIILQALFMVAPEANATALLKRATWRCVYDLDTLPLAVGMIARQHHYHNPVIPDGQGTEPILRFSYSDGLGRVLMHKAQAEPAALTPLVPRWVGSGRTIYNNKGSAVMQYEPYFSDTHLCDDAELATLWGVSAKLFYDGLNRNYKTELPDGTFTKTEWTAWEQQVWDNNDTVLESQWYEDRIYGAMGPEEQAAAQKTEAHANTPTVMHTDTLARPFYTIQQDSQTSFIYSYETLDIQGNRLSVAVLDQSLVPPQYKYPLQYRYNMLQAPCYQKSVDSGTQRTLLDVAGQPLYAWDAEDRETEIAYDMLRRPLDRKVTAGGITRTLELYHYGEGQPNDKEMNLRGQLYKHYDGSGRQVIPEGYDFKGNPLQTVQYLLEDRTLTDADWGGYPEPEQESVGYKSYMTIDALGRPVRMTDPGENITEHLYDRGGALKKVKLNGSDYVQDIHYDAKGQRQAIWYSNGTKTGYTYDAETFRLRRLLTVRLSDNVMMQDLHYWYDPVGNITEIQDDAQQTLFYANTIIEPTQKFTYDALYRLITAEGREQIGTATFGVQDNWNDASWCVPLGSDAAQRYIQYYTYDDVGNILQLQHIATSGSYTRDYIYSSSSNRLESCVVGSSEYAYEYDDRGNMVAMPHLAAMDWNVDNELQAVSRGGRNNWYQYSGGQRTRKYLDKGSYKEERIYFGSFEIYRKFDNASSLIVERQTVHVSDDTGRIAMLEKRTIGSAVDDNDTLELLTRYIYSNHLQSASLELDETAGIISYEEYHPYGTTSFQANSTTIAACAKRYRYTGKERDEESGLYYHGARYYIPWLCRWTAVDPLESKYAGMSPYNYCLNNPVKNIDDDGEDVITITEKSITRTTIHFSKFGTDATSSSTNMTLDIKIKPSAGPDKFIFKRTTQTITSYNEYNFQSKKWNNTISASQERTYYQKSLNPLNPKSASGATTHLGYWMQDLLTFKINDPDSVTVGKMMSYDKVFSAYMTGRYKDAAQWEKRGSALNTLDAFAPAYAQIMFGFAVGEVGGVFLSGSKYKNLGALKKSARTLQKGEDVLMSTEAGLQSSTSKIFDNVILGTKGDKSTTYLWTIDERGVNVALEQTPMATPRGNIVHSNISEKAYIAGEAWFESNNTVIINAGSGRFGDGNPLVNQKTWEAAKQVWTDLGYNVKAMPFGKR